MKLFRLQLESCEYSVHKIADWIKEVFPGIEMLIIPLECDDCE